MRPVNKHTCALLNAYCTYLVGDICQNILQNFFLSIGTDLDMQDLMDQMIARAVQRA